MAVGLHPQDPGDPLGTAGRGVQHGVPLSQCSGVEAQIGQSTGGGDVHLEHQRGERPGGIGGPLHLGTLGSLGAPNTFGTLCAHGRSAHRGNVQRRGQVGRDGGQQRFDTAVAVGRSAQHDHGLAAVGEVPQRCGQGRGGECRVLVVLLQCGRMEPGHRLVQPSAPVLGLGPELLRYRPLPQAVPSWAVVPGQSTHRQQVDDTGEVALPSDGQLDGERDRVQPFPDGGDGRVQVGAGPVHLVDEGDPGHAVPVGLAPDALALRFHPGDGVEHRDRPVQHPQRTFDLVGEVDVPGGVDEVDPMAVPEAADGGGEDGDAAFALLRVAVGDGGPVVDLAALVGLAGQEEDPLGDGGLARVHVGEDAQVADGGDAGQDGGGSSAAGGGDGVVRTADVGAHGPVPFEVERGAGAARLRRRRARPCLPRPAQPLTRLHPARPSPVNAGMEAGRVPEPQNPGHTGHTGHTGHSGHSGHTGSRALGRAEGNRKAEEPEGGGRPEG